MDWLVGITGDTFNIDDGNEDEFAKVYLWIVPGF